MPTASIPFGSLWSVLPRGYPLRGSSIPKRLGYAEGVDSVFFTETDVLTVGGEVFDRFLGNTHHFVEVLLPRHAWVNRSLFNEGMGYLKRIA